MLYSYQKGGLGSGKLMVRLNNLEGLFQPK